MRSPSSSSGAELSEWKLTPADSSAAYRSAPPLEFHPSDPSARRLCGVCHMFDATRGTAEPTERAIWTALFCRYCAQYVPETLPLNARCRQVLGRHHRCCYYCCCHCRRRRRCCCHLYRRRFCRRQCRLSSAAASAAAAAAAVAAAAAAAAAAAGRRCAAAGNKGPSTSAAPSSCCWR